MYIPQAIGTPNSDCATVVMILGAGELGRELTIALQRFGVEVQAVDLDRGPPTDSVAKHAHVLVLMDGDALRELITEIRPHIVVPEIEALAVDVLAELEEEGAVTVAPTARAAQLTMDREKI